ARIDEAEFKAWLRRLDADRFADRERAGRALADLGAAAEPLLRGALRASESAEVRARGERVLDPPAAGRCGSPRAGAVGGVGGGRWRCWRWSAVRRRSGPSPASRAGRPAPPSPARPPRR